jgi:hypothetical protein
MVWTKGTRGNPFIGVASQGGMGQLSVAARAWQDSARMRDGRAQCQWARREVYVEKGLCHLLLSVLRWQGEKQRGGPTVRKGVRASA